MIIVDQDKSNIVNFDRTINIGLEERSTLSDEIEISAQTDGYTVILGKYKTATRAREVVKEIITANSNFIYFKTATKEGKDYIINLLKAKYEQFDIYEMPKE